MESHGLQAAEERGLPVHEFDRREDGQDVEVTVHISDRRTPTHLCRGFVLN